MAETEPGASLLELVRRDFRPVRPILRTSFRSAIALALAGAATVLFLLGFGYRSDLASMGDLYFVLLALRVAVGSVLIGVALREAIPASGLPRSLGSALLIGSVALLVLLPFAVANRAENIPFSMQQLACYWSELLIAGPSFAVSYWLLSRAYPLRPLFASAAAGLGAGLIADAALFSHCAIDQPAHVIIAHEGAVVTIAVAGALLGWILQRKRLAPLRRY